MLIAYVSYMRILYYHIDISFSIFSLPDQDPPVLEPETDEIPIKKVKEDSMDNIS